MLIKLGKGVQGMLKRRKVMWKELKIGLAGTKLVVKKVSNMVVKHDKQIKKNAENIKKVNKRVDVVEQDLEETKEKVEEIDMKVYSDLYECSGIMLREYQRNQYTIALKSRSLLHRVYPPTAR